MKHKLKPMPLVVRQRNVIKRDPVAGKLSHRVDSRTMIYLPADYTPEQVQAAITRFIETKNKY